MTERERVREKCENGNISRVCVNVHTLQDSPAAATSSFSRIYIFYIHTNTSLPSSSSSSRRGKNTSPFYATRIQEEKCTVRDAQWYIYIYNAGMYMVRFRGTHSFSLPLTSHTLHVCASALLTYGVDFSRAKLLLLLALINRSIGALNCCGFSRASSLSLSRSSTLSIFLVSFLSASCAHECIIIRLYEYSRIRRRERRDSLYYYYIA